MAPEVLIYIQTIKNYFISNDAARNYFNIKDKNDEFFDYVMELSEKNFNENGEPELTLQQFEEARRKISKPTENRDEITGIFITMGDMGYISLN